MRGCTPLRGSFLSGATQPLYCPSGAQTQTHQGLLPCRAIALADKSLYIFVVVLFSILSTSFVRLNPAPSLIRDRDTTTSKSSLRAQRRTHYPEFREVAKLPSALAASVNPPVSSAVGGPERPPAGRAPPAPAEPHAAAAPVAPAAAI